MPPGLKSLDQLPIGHWAVIHSFTDAEMSLRLLELGCIPGERVKVERFAPLGDPMAISVSGYCLSLRKAEASSVLVLADSE